MTTETEVGEMEQTESKALAAAHLNTERVDQSENFALQVHVELCHSLGQPDDANWLAQVAAKPPCLAHPFLPGSSEFYIAGSEPAKTAIFACSQPLRLFTQGTDRNKQSRLDGISNATNK
ncbi:UNVERIFIED_CONTAM: hypothetical protein K2H54_034115 [Gekko kuhli]